MSNKIKESNITDSAVTTSKIADNAITSDKIAPGAVVAADVGDGTITTAKIADSNVTTAKIAADAIDGTKIADDAIDSEHITDGSVDNVHLAGSIANDKLTNSSITINGTSIALGASGDISAGTDWQAVITADGSTFNTAVAGEGYFIDTTSAVHTITLPASPTQGDEVTIVDYAGTFGTNNVTVGRNGSNIDGTATDATLGTNRLNVRFVYVDATQGWKAVFDKDSTSYGAQFVTATGGTVTTTGDYKFHAFTSSGCFAVSCSGNAAGSSSVDYLVIAGGGAGHYDNGGGGGAGGFRYSNSTFPVACSPGAPLSNPTGLSVSVQTYPITVGAGAAGANFPASPTVVNSGSDSVFSTITSAGGGGGASCGPNNPAPSGYNAGKPGGSGGGSGQFSNPCNPNSGGSGNTPPVSPPQGNGGGNISPSYPNLGAAGGGGAIAAGSDTPSNADGGAGGSGAGIPTTSFFNPTSTYGARPGDGYAYFSGGGGGGSGQPGGGTGGAAGIGGATAGGTGPSPSTNATANTGGGAGGGGQAGNGASGGSGIVIIRYKYQ